MAALGTYLRQLREERRLSLDEVGRVTRVPARYLQALERDDFGVLPPAVFTRGYIRAYCQALGMAPDEALTRFAENVDGRAGRAPATKAPRGQLQSDARHARGTLLVSFGLLVAFGLALFIMALYLQSGRPEVATRRTELARRDAMNPGTKSPDAVRAPSASRAPAPPSPMTSPPLAPPTPPAVTAPAPWTVPSPPSAPVAEPLPVREPKTVMPTEPRPLAPAVRSTPDAVRVPSDGAPLRLVDVASPYRLVARTSEATWLRVRTEDGRATEETIPAGEIREWISNRPFVVSIGNAAGVALELNGRKLPPLGGRGAVINRLVLPPAEP